MSSEQVTLISNCAPPPLFSIDKREHMVLPKTLKWVVVYSSVMFYFGG